MRDKEYNFKYWKMKGYKGVFSLIEKRFFPLPYTSPAEVVDQPGKVNPFYENGSIKEREEALLKYLRGDNFFNRPGPFYIVSFRDYYRMNEHNNGVNSDHTVIFRYQRNCFRDARYIDYTINDPSGGIFLMVLRGAPWLYNRSITIKKVRIPRLRGENKRRFVARLEAILENEQSIPNKKFVGTTRRTLKRLENKENGKTKTNT